MYYFIFLFVIFTTSIAALSFTTLHTVGEVPANMLRWHHDRMQTSIGQPVDIVRWGNVTLLALPQLTTANFSAGETLAWQSWNGHMGLAALWSLEKYNSEFLFGYAHRSDHVSDYSSYQKKFLLSEDVWFDNRSLRSYEYLFLQHDRSWALNNKFRLDFTGNLRTFTPPLNPYSPYAQKVSVGARIVTVRNFGRAEVFQSLYSEYLWLDYRGLLTIYREKYRNPPNYAWGIETGYRRPLRKNQLFQIILGWRRAPGRLFDFVETVQGVDFNISVLTMLDEPITVLEGF